MRKIRVWDKKEKRMIYFDPIKIYCELLNEGDAWYDPDRTHCVNDYIMQFPTGLKDKNGKEIYEGDKIITKDRYRWTEHTGIVMWAENIAGFMINVGEQHLSFFDIALSETKIIGNIYGNPELLKEVKP